MCVVIESPFRALGPERALAYLDDCLRDSIARGEAPIASHGLYTRVLQDANPAEREHGMEMGWAWMRCADLVAVYSDHGITLGMELGIRKARELGIPVEFRDLQGTLDP